MGQFFKGNQAVFARIGGVIVILIGLYQLGIFGNSKTLDKTRKLPVRVNALAMSPAMAVVLGFTFSFAWTPCVGPALTSVLVMAASAATRTKGFLLIGVYTLGFVLPFLMVGLFTTNVLAFFKKHRSIVSYTVKIGAVLMILMGIMMVTGKMNSITGYLSEISQPKTESTGAAETVPETTEPEAEPASDEEETVPVKEDPAETEKETEAAENVLPAIDFTLQDQYGNTHTLADYAGKTIFLNFWATWCPPCRNEMPEIQMLHEEFSAEEDPEVVILGVAAPDYGDEGSVEDITAFLEENGYTYPVLMDMTLDLFMSYGIFSYPTTFMIDANGNVFGYVTGQLNEEMMRSIIEQTVSGVRVQ
ncbi:MAG: redoxin domain-containing protein [Lachnospiraceae bacterium]|nr:redoxin domain-containing protein [Lachnospiraceae bacterium]